MFERDLHSFLNHGRSRTCGLAVRIAAWKAKTCPLSHSKSKSLLGIEINRVSGLDLEKQVEELTGAIVWTVKRQKGQMMSRMQIGEVFRCPLSLP
jgi:hypothetical protein